MPVTVSGEDVRLAIGLSKTQLEALEKVHTLKKISALWDRFKRVKGKALDQEFEKPAFVLEDVPYLASIQVARALGVGEFHLANLIDRNKLHGHQHGRRTIFKRENLDALFDPPPDGRRGALASAFMRWVEMEA